MARGVVEAVAGFLAPFGTSWAQTLRLDGCGKDLGRALETSRGRSPGHIGGRRGKAYEAACTERGIKPSKTQYQGDLGVSNVEWRSSMEEVIMCVSDRSISCVANP